MALILVGAPVTLPLSREGLAAMKRKSSLLAKYERLSIVPLSMIAVGIVLAFVAEPLGDYWGGLAFVGALVLILGGVLLLFLFFVVKVAIWVLQRVGTTTGSVVEEVGQAPPPAPVTSGLSWRVTLPDGTHVVSLEDERLHPSRLVCDGQWIDLTWPRRRGKPAAAFTIAGHRATLVEAPDLRRSLRQTFGPGNLFGLGGTVPLVYRRHLSVDGASAEPFNAGGRLALEGDRVWLTPAPPMGTGRPTRPDRASAPHPPSPPAPHRTLRSPRMIGRAPGVRGL